MAKAGSRTEWHGQSWRGTFRRRQVGRVAQPLAAQQAAHGIGGTIGANMTGFGAVRRAQQPAEMGAQIGADVEGSSFPDGLLQPLTHDRGARRSGNPGPGRGLVGVSRREEIGQRPLHLRREGVAGGLHRVKAVTGMVGDAGQIRRDGRLVFFYDKWG